MLVKKENKSIKYLKIFLLILFFIIVFIFRDKFTNLFLISYQKLFSQNLNTQTTETEKEELGRLRVENKLLKDEIKKVREGFFVGDINESKSIVYMLLGESSLYGDFYTSMPKNKTPYVGMNILSEGNIVIAQVTEILQNSLKVKRLGQGKSFIAISLESEESFELKSSGIGLYSGTVSGGSKISLGDTIVLKGYPKTVVGTVVEIEKSATALSNIFVRTPYNIANKEIFYVIQ